MCVQLQYRLLYMCHRSEVADHQWPLLDDGSEPKASPHGTFSKLTADIGRAVRSTLTGTVQLQPIGDIWLFISSIARACTFYRSTFWRVALLARFLSRCRHTVDVITS